MEKPEENFYGDDPGDLDISLHLRSTLSEAIRQSPKKREQIAEEMSHLLDRSISVPMLNSFTAESREGHRFPAAWVPAFCKVTGDVRLIQLLAEACGARLATEKEWQLIDFARAVIDKERADRRLKQMADFLLGGDK